jgi:hypothetical protein
MEKLKYIKAFKTMFHDKLDLSLSLGIMIFKTYGYRVNNFPSQCIFIKVRKQKKGKTLAIYLSNYFCFTEKKNKLKQIGLRLLMLSKYYRTDQTPFRKSRQQMLHSLTQHLTSLPYHDCTCHTIHIKYVI